ncbi:hypothetical protein [Amycolatopsis saalfeldensis]|uniref:hypothetical protein n=1 Tax=Amycolatopsis saalfeldensis TaxID=394193 RepID=UPI001FE3DFDE|nr:hypothetical protein [Amycolatopsis saalfeldensis]
MDRRACAVVPPRVEHRLTALGRPTGGRRHLRSDAPRVIADGSAARSHSVATSRTDLREGSFGATAADQPVPLRERGRAPVSRAAHSCGERHLVGAGT